MTSFAVVAGVAEVVEVAGVAGVVVDGAFCMSVSSPGCLVVAGVVGVVEIAELRLVVVSWASSQIARSLPLFVLSAGETIVGVAGEAIAGAVGATIAGAFCVSVSPSVVGAGGSLPPRRSLCKTRTKRSVFLRQL